ncbi:hypothetical protein MUB24_14950 [Lederbergia sp. NSJ-179]|uniref:hypothetical protein n=1 Tax=Lederbergia sp. NSJ-179 TaxID=2931402 RepID=UPI001FD08682|nr:hypothetical protein [Lederbergia sp. NSJ-179]MCJ7842176.1 hypothetical protein [Lederbergia sp. NSJ-179]
MARKSLSPYILLGIGIAGATYLVKEENRHKAFNSVQSIKRTVQKWYNGANSKIQEEMMEKAGHPDPFDQGDANMVAEGAMYAVEYYNKEEQ